MPFLLFLPHPFFLGEFQLLIWLNFCLGWVFFWEYDCSCLDWFVILFGLDLDLVLFGLSFNFNFVDGANLLEARGGEDLFLLGPSWKWVCNMYHIYWFWVEPEGAWAPIDPYWFVPEWIFNLFLILASKDAIIKKKCNLMMDL